MLGTMSTVMSGEELARNLLCMNIDLLFNGGVGTYVKHSEESNLNLGDKQNEAVRVDASELQCEIVCEGGNLGFTQKARIEFAVGGGKINIDGIDNAAGVDTSDHEVNLKILLNIIKEKGYINEKESQDILQSLTQQVVNMVLWSNYRQALALSRDEALSRLYLDDFNSTIDILSENIESFNRRDFFIPKTENIKNILTKDSTIVRPVLSSLLSYSKIFIKKLLLESTLIDEEYSVDFLYKYFPKSFVSVYEHEIKTHPLRRQIISTVVADTIINLQGASFVHDYNRLGGAKFLDKIKSYLIGNNLFGANDIRFEIFRHDYTMPLSTQYELLSSIEKTLTFSTKWMLNYLDSEQIDSAHILDYKDRLFDLLNSMDSNEVDQELLIDNEPFNRFFATIDYLRFAVAAIVIKEHTDNNFENVANLFYLIFREMKIMKLLRILDDLKINEDADRQIKAQMLHYIEFIVVNLTHKILNFQRAGESPEDAFNNYLNSDTTHCEMTIAQIDKLLAQEYKDVKEVVITINQLVVLAI
jgi:glutamate dehydrogenase